MLSKSINWFLYDADGNLVKSLIDDQGKPFLMNFLMDIQRRIQNPVKHLRWNVFRKQLAAFSPSLFSQNAPS